jgi:hypothetical protein
MSSSACGGYAFSNKNVEVMDMYVRIGSLELTNVLVLLTHYSPLLNYTMFPSLEFLPEDATIISISLVGKHTITDLTVNIPCISTLKDSYADY